MQVYIIVHEYVEKIPGRKTQELLAMEHEKGGGADFCVNCEYKYWSIFKTGMS